MNLKDTYNRIAEDWYKNHYTDERWTEATDKFISFLQPENLVLDVGCGPGMKSKYLINKGLKVVGIDISEKMIEIARREAPAGKFYVMDMKDIDKLKENFDGIFAHACLLHIPKKEIRKILKILLNKLKKGSYIHLAVKEKKPEEQEEEVVVEKDYGYTYRRFFSYFTPDEVKNYLRDLKMEIIYETVALHGDRRWIEVIAKK